ncbi:MAG: DNA gyrase subunit A [Candidatus Spyradocola sp.]|nr:DNA gyrase subunit A [Candidatus Spyradocola sp.]
MDNKDNYQGERLVPLDIEHELKNSFISYAMAVIVSRALPDVRDGLKPVHRRILYSMTELGMTPDKPFRKSARIVGDVLGKYHPHGDTAVYDAMVRLAQDFSMRYPLVEGQGNFGSVDGDSPAAMRYTEARLSKMAADLTADLDKQTVDFYPNFDETLMQPEVLPSRFPNLLVNGSGGIAVGMATNIPPHNMGEVIDGVVYMLDHPDCTVGELMDIIKGPDFPTAGLIMGMNGIKSAYLTGKGRIIMRARTEIEPINANRSRIVVTEIPYQVNKARLVEKIAELVHEKRVEGISDLRDESDRRGMRIVIELKKDVNPQIVLNTLFKHTQMQETFGVNMLALVGGVPRVLNLQQMLYYYIEHQKDVIVRRTRYDLGKAEARAHILEGLLVALDHIDEVVNLIRTSKTGAEAKEGLMTRFGLTEKQAQAILDMRLQRLVGLERQRLHDEYVELEKTIAHLREVLGSEELVRGIIREEILAIRAKYADPRRTEIVPIANEIELADLIQEENMAVTLTHFGYVKRVTADTYRAQKRGGKGITGMTTREEDYAEHIFVTSTHTDLMFFTSRGRVFRKTCYEIPEAGRTAKGTAIVNLLQLDGGEKVTTVIPVKEGARGMLVMTTRNGVIKKTELGEFENIRASGLIAVTLRGDDELIGVALTDGTKELLLGTRGGMSIRFHESDVRPMGRSAMGVKAMELDEGDEIVSMSVVDEDSQVLTISENGYGKRTEVREYRVQSRGGKGIKAMQLTDKTGRLAALMQVHEDEDVMMIADDGTIIRTAVADISTQSRSTQGVRVMRLMEGSCVVAVTTTEKVEEQPEDAETPAENAADEELLQDENAKDAVSADDLSYQGDEQSDIARLLERAESEDENI